MRGLRLCVSVVAWTFHGVPPASVPVVACFPGGVSAVSVGVTKCTVEVTEVVVKQHVDGVRNVVFATDAANNFGRVGDALMVS